ncbi:hypothetical protein NQZ79_g8367 [Umbelopsis isabellina]|nr:hypothetical protein NQZ79_g8367 [Umbelopsis isabellina]
MLHLALPYHGSSLHEIIRQVTGDPSTRSRCCESSNAHKSLLCPVTHIKYGMQHGMYPTTIIPGQCELFQSMLIEIMLPQSCMVGVCLACRELGLNLKKPDLRK